MTDFRTWREEDFDALEKRLREAARSRTGINLHGAMHAFEPEWQAADAIEHLRKSRERIQQECDTINAVHRQTAHQLADLGREVEQLQAAIRQKEGEKK